MKTEFKLARVVADLRSHADHYFDAPSPWALGLYFRGYESAGGCTNPFAEVVRQRVASLTGIRLALNSTGMLFLIRTDDRAAYLRLSNTFQRNIADAIPGPEVTRSRGVRQRGVV